MLGREDSLPAHPERTMWNPVQMGQDSNDMSSYNTRDSMNHAITELKDHANYKVPKVKYTINTVVSW